MDFYSIVRNEHLNQYNHLFGGIMLQWVDEYAYMAAVREFPGVMFVTRAMDHVEFKRGVLNGSMLRFQVERTRKGSSSVNYQVQVFSRAPGKVEENPVFSTIVTMVAVDGNGGKAQLP
ncbi:MAG: acyl-CoA thioesterase [Victivallales bacterium]|nr:acyl-CoA thioesterase [Victivallales bacterium]